MNLELFEQEYLGNSLQAWCVAAGIFAGLFVIAWLVRWVLIAQLKERAPRTANIWDDVLLLLLQKTHLLFIFLICSHIGAQSLHLAPKVSKVGDFFFFLILFVQMGFWASHALVFLGDEYANKALERDAGRATTIRALLIFGKIFVWLVVFLLLLDNWGVKVAPFVAGLGIGGVAIALAVQNILGDLLASLSIVFDKPFVIGDTINVGTETGTVEKIGLKTTRLRSVMGEQLIFSNADLLQSRVRNFKRMDERRGDLNFGVTYETAPEKLKKIPEIVKQIVESEEGLRFDRCSLFTLGASALEFQSVYFVNSPDYKVFASKHHAVCLKLIEAFRQANIDFAYPTHTIYQHRAP